MAEAKAAALGRVDAPEQVELAEFADQLAVEAFLAVALDHPRQDPVASEAADRVQHHRGAVVELGRRRRLGGGAHRSSGPGRATPERGFIAVVPPSTGRVAPVT